MAHQRIHATGSSTPGTEIERQLLEQIKQLKLSTIPDLKLKWRELKRSGTTTVCQAQFSYPGNCMGTSGKGLWWD